MKLTYLACLAFLLLAYPLAAQPRKPIDKKLAAQWLDSCALGGQTTINFKFTTNEIQGNILTQKAEAAQNAQRKKVLLKKEPKDALTYYELFALETDSIARKPHRATCLAMIETEIAQNALAQKDAANGELYYLKGLLYQKDSRFEEAFQQYVQANSLMPDSAKVYQRVGELYFFTLQYPKAFEFFERALKMDNKIIDTHMYHIMSQSFLAMARFAEGEAQGKSIASMSEETKQDFSLLDNAIAQYPTQQALQDLRLYAETFGLFYKAMVVGIARASEKNLTLTDFRLADFFYLSPADRQATDRLEKAFSRLCKVKYLANPALAYEGAGMCALLRGEEATALKQMEKSLKLNPEKGIIYHNISFMHIIQKRYEQARKILYQKIATQKEAGDFVTIAGLYGREDNFPKAKETCLQGLASFKDSAELWALLGTLEGRAGEFAPAEEHLKKAIELSSKDIENFYKLALLQLAGGRWEEARANLEICKRDGHKQATAILAGYFE